ncbi:MAG: hypothetical protein Hals2KO_02390 [Halioglobus sp.]
MAATYKEIILHAGLGKTGTTSIQNNCFHKRETLAEHGIVYPSFMLKGHRLVNHTDAITGALCTRTASYGFGFRREVASEEEAAQLGEDLRAQLLPLLEQPAGDTLVLSGEGVAEYDRTDLQRVEQALASATERLRVVIYIRSPQSAIESMLQQRVQNAQLKDPDDMVGVVRDRYKRLSKQFGSKLEVVNFHDALEHPSGLVGSFMELIGLPANVVSELDLSRSNERVSQEAFELMAEINRCHPRGAHHEGGVRRRHHDMQALFSLPGQPFRMLDYVDSAVYASALKEATWLERKLGFKFPPVEQKDEKPLWQDDTLFVLEEKIRGLPNPLREAATDYLEAMAAENRLGAQQSAVLRFVAARVQALDDDPIPERVEQLGADYFKFAALQVERASPRMALQLMEIAQALNPEGAQINQRVAMYREQLDD